MYNFRKDILTERAEELEALKSAHELAYVVASCNFPCPGLTVTYQSASRLKSLNWGGTDLISLAGIGSGHLWFENRKS